MYEIKINKWTVNVQQKDGKVVEKKETLLDAITMILGTVDTGKGFESFMSMHNIAKAISDYKASDTDLLKLEEKEYELIKNLMKENMPSQWAMHEKLSKELMIFFDLKQK